MTDFIPHTGYHEHHPQWLRRRVSTYWWLERWPYVVFILREISSVFVAWFVLYLILLFRAMTRDAIAYQAFLDWSARPWVLLLNVVSAFFIIFHSITWLNLAPKAMVVHAPGGKRVPPSVIALSNYAALVVASALVAWLLLRG
jgi:fumarate reductase subunit C